MPDWVWDQVKEGICAKEVKIAAEEDARPKRPASLARGKKGLVAGWTHPKHMKLRK